MSFRLQYAAPAAAPLTRIPPRPTAAGIAQLAQEDEDEADAGGAVIVLLDALVVLVVDDPDVENELNEDAISRAV